MTTTSDIAFRGETRTSKVARACWRCDGTIHPGETYIRHTRRDGGAWKVTAEHYVCPAPVCKACLPLALWLPALAVVIGAIAAILAYWTGIG